MKIFKFKDWSIFSKIISSVVLSIILFAGFIFIYVLPIIKDNLTESKKNSIKNLVESTYSITQDFESRVVKGEMTMEEAQKNALQRIKGMRYDDNNYFWVNDMVPKMIIHPLKPELDGKDITDNRDPNGKQLFVEMVKVCKASEEGFVDYFWPKPGFAKPVPKISYVKLFKSWGWIIGTGVYVENIDEQVSAIRQQILIALIIIVIVSAGIGFFIARIIATPVKKLGKIADQLSAGNVKVAMDINSQDETGKLAQSFRKMIDTIKDVIGEMNILTKAAVEGKLSVRGNAAKFQGSWLEIVQGLNGTLDAVIGPLNMSAEYIDRISKGDIPQKITDTYYGDFNEIKNNLNNCIDNINALIVDVNVLAKSAVEGKLSARAEASKHQGDFRKIVQGFNNTLDAVIGPLNMSAEYIDRISKGDIPQKITDTYYGDFNEIKNNLNNCIDNINALIVDVNVLAKSAVEGKLSTRAEALKHQGDFRKIIQGFNNTLDAVINPLNTSAEYFDRISKGDIPQKITDTYHGDFNEIKNNLNNCIDNIRTLVEEVNILAKAAVEGKLSTRADASKLHGDYQKIIKGFNNTLDAVIHPIEETVNVLKKMAEGDLSTKVVGEYKGDHAILKNALNSTIDLMPFKEAVAVMKSASEGDLTKYMVKEYKGESLILKEAVNEMIQQRRKMVMDLLDEAKMMNSASNNLLQVSEQVANAATELSAQTGTAAASSEQVSANVTTVSTAAEEMSASIKEISKNTNKAANLSGESQTAANTASEVMNRLGLSSSEIGNIVKTITSIAEQTNLLALNATIEAARAGESGKGFAVVANEVKELAKESAKATEDITQRIKMIQDESTNAINVIKGIIENIRQVSDISNTIASAVEEQTVTTTEVNRNIAEASKAVTSIVEVNGGIASAVSEYSKMSENIKTNASQMQQLAVKLENQLRTNYKL
jgi:methyl-accepting chemotaxis protein